MTIAPGPSDETAPVAREHADWLHLAVSLAVENVAAGGGPFGAVVVRDGQVLAEGVNMVTPTLDPTAHAEVVAIRHACRAVGHFALTGATLYASCEPCPLCLSAILWARVDRVLYTATSDDAVSAGFDDRRFSELFGIPPAQWPTPVTRLAVPTARAPFDAWDARTDRIHY